MTIPVLKISSDSPVESIADVLVLATVGSGTDVTLLAPAGFEAVAALLSPLQVSAAADRVVRVPSVAGSATSIALVGLGKTRTVNALRDAAAAAVRALAGTEHVALAFPTETAEEVDAVIEGAALGAYNFTDYRGSTAAEQKAPVEAVTLLTTAGTTESNDRAVARAIALADAVNLVKDLVNTPALDMYPESLAAAAVQAADGLPLEFTVWDEAALVADGFGGISGVGQGSTRGPRLVKVSYNPTGAAAHLALVGKGITFDTGGLSLKPSNSMLGMKDDMAGAATVLAATIAAAELALPVRVTAWLCIAENMPSGSAIRPGDVLTIRGGTTIEVTNTDAEGRLVLADGLVAAGEEQPDAIIDVATLTGAAIVALGMRTTGLMGGNEELIESLVAAADNAGEPIWPMPLPAELRRLLDSDIADMMNANVNDRSGGMLVAGHFLKEFETAVEGDSEKMIPWAHLDIAGPAQNNGGAYGVTGHGPTGAMVRTLVGLAEEFSRRS